MRILMVNKFLYPKGGAETYALKLGAYLQSQGHEVQYFGMEHENRCVGNRVDAYTRNMDFHGGSRLVKLTYPLRTIYSSEARRKIRMVLEDFRPDVCHLNNFNYQLTPSIILEIRKWETERGHKCRIVYTAHDPQLVCPNHMCMNPNTLTVCEDCFGGKYINCLKGRCIHGSYARSFLGTVESTLWNWVDVYSQIDTIVCCSRFMKSLLDTNPVLAARTVVMHNFIEPSKPMEVQKKNYVLYFGRYSQEKGVKTLLWAAKHLPQIPFVFAGSGPLENLLGEVGNITNVGFQSGEALNRLIREARFSVIPSEGYENCPFSVLESISLGTPVLGAQIGGIPELIRVGETGELFKSGDREQLADCIARMWNDPARIDAYSRNCREAAFDTVQQYTQKLIRVAYGSDIISEQDLNNKEHTFGG